ncbi:MAG TPA: hypothetical protein VK176_16345 [Phycisphaerales bacterium]|nr:hypothetical protein [Phycisphaerales bacterium]
MSADPNGDVPAALRLTGGSDLTKPQDFGKLLAHALHQQAEADSATRQLLEQLKTRSGDLERFSRGGGFASPADVRFAQALALFTLHMLTVIDRDRLISETFLPQLEASLMGAIEANNATSDGTATRAERVRHTLNLIELASRGRRTPFLPQDAGEARKGAHLVAGTTTPVQ